MLTGLGCPEGQQGETAVTEVADMSDIFRYPRDII